MPAAHVEEMITETETGVRESSSLFRSTNMPSLSMIDSVNLRAAPSGTAYSANESRLYDYMMNSEYEQKRVHTRGRTTVDWVKFANRWSYWCRVEIASGSSGYLARTKDQLKQRRKDLSKRANCG